MTRISDPDVRLLVSLAGGLRDDYLATDRKWDESPFGWIRQRPSRQRGKIGEQLVAGLCAAKDFDVVKSPDSDADRIIGGLRAEIKFSTLWDSGCYKFQQFRKQNYDIVFCLGISPFDAHCWILTKQAVLEAWGTPGGLEAQHGGRAGKDTAWLTVVPDRPPQVLARCGGRIGSAIDRLRSLAP